MLEKARAVLRDFQAAEAAAADSAGAAGRSKDSAIGAATEALRLLGEVIERRNEISAIIAANIPGHEWDGTELRLMNPDGTIGAAVNLQGPRGFPGIEGPPGPPSEQDRRVPVGAATGALFIPAPEHLGTLRVLTSGGEVTVELRADLEEGYNVALMQGGDGNLIFTPGDGASLSSPDGLNRSRRRFSEVVAKVFANPDGASAQWVIGGDLGEFVLEPPDGSSFVAYLGSRVSYNGVLVTYPDGGY
ncbi:hypothetical protein OLZ32_27895 [Rhizobium sp. 1AS11]|uniref:hypothetical protein n=1 Tax=Rhizobium acaciae TaxID=2989736 RepID=UPI00222312F8|nr:hypothetical protein [Rhizobium acaciae]MCW1412176.1 hypothetical protein [Rhizobium acaciae]MCW1744191.1 hypothetical protein [Rhizobium acaciae]